MLTVCLVPANVHSVQCTTVLCSCTLVSGLALPVTLLCSARNHPGGTPGQCDWYNFVWPFCTGHWPGPVCFNAADRRRDAGPLGAIIFTLRPPRELFISTCCPAPALTISQGGDHMIRPMGGRGWGELTNKRPGYSVPQLLTTNFIAIAEIMLV